MARSTPTPSSPSFGSLLMAGVAGGAVVAVAAGLAWSTMKPGDAGPGDLAPRLAALQSKVDELSARPAAAGISGPGIADLTSKIARLEQAIANRPAAGGGAADPALAGRLTAAEAAVTALTEHAARTDRRLEEVASTAGGTAAPATPGVQPAEVAALAGQIATVERTVASESATVERKLAALQQQVADRAAMPVSDKGVRLAVLAAGLRTLVERGAPYAGELAAAKQLVSDPQTFAPLEPFAATGVPNALTLGRELGDAVPAMLKAGDLPSPENYLDRLQVQAEKLVRVRPVKVTVGDDLAAIIGSAEAKARQADLAGALADLAKLPAAVRAPAEPWIKKAEARQAAVAAAQRVSTAALGALANP